MGRRSENRLSFADAEDLRESIQSYLVERLLIPANSERMDIDQLAQVVKTEYNRTNDAVASLKSIIDADKAERSKLKTFDHQFPFVQNYINGLNEKLREEHDAVKAFNERFYGTPDTPREKDRSLLQKLQHKKVSYDYHIHLKVKSLIDYFEKDYKVALNMVLNDANCVKQAIAPRIEQAIPVRVPG